jgi:cell division protein FtsZ
MINIRAPEVEPQMRPRILVVGVGGAGGNAVNNMIRSNLEGVDFLVANTDAQALAGSLADKKLQLGRTITKGLGAGARPDIGRGAAEEAMNDIIAHMEGANMLFITAGMGGGTGTGAAPVIAQAAREAGILTVGVVTKPFHFEGAHRMRLAEQGIAELQQYVDTLIVIPNQNLFRIANEKTTFADAFKMADDVLHSGVRGVTDLMVIPGMINLDFADIRTVMAEMGKAMMGTGEATGERRAIDAAEAAISNPLLDDVSMKGAQAVLVNITGGLDMTLFEVDEAVSRVRNDVDPDAQVLFGSALDPSMEGRMRVSVVATGIEADAMRAPQPSVHAPYRAPAPKPIAVPKMTTRIEPAPSFFGGVTAMPLGQPSLAGLEAVAQSAAALRASAQAARGATMAAGQPAITAGGGTTATAEALQPAQIEETDILDLTEEEKINEPLPTVTLTPEPIAAPVVTPPRAEVKNEAFIPPRAVTPPPRPTVQTAAPAVRPAPAGAEAAAVRKPGGLLQSMLKGTWRAKPTEAAAEPAPAPAPAAPTAPAGRRAPTVKVQETAQPSLAMDPKDRPSFSQAEQEMLEIPAFLRRQAN